VLKYYCYLNFRVDLVRLYVLSALLLRIQVF